MAKVHSDGNQALSGGDLGYKSAAALPALFLEEAQNMEIGDISPLIETSRGYHILKLLARRGGDLKEQVERVRLSHIFLPLEDPEKVREIHLQVKNGKPFAEAVAEHSIDEVSIPKEGDFGWFLWEDIPPYFTEAVAKMSIGDISEPIESPLRLPHPPHDRKKILRHRHENNPRTSRKNPTRTPRPRATRHLASSSPQRRLCPRPRPRLCPLTPLRPPSPPTPQPPPPPSPSPWANPPASAPTSAQSPSTATSPNPSSSSATATSSPPAPANTTSPSPSKTTNTTPPPTAPSGTTPPPNPPPRPPHPENAPSILETLQQATHHCLRGTFSALVTTPPQQSQHPRHRPHLHRPNRTPSQTHRRPPQRHAPRLPDPPHRPRHHPPPPLPSPRRPHPRNAHRHPPHPPQRPKTTLRHPPPPRIRVCALNPHAGESGLLGDEEDRIIHPAITAARAAGIIVDGPHPADTLMSNAKLPETACILAMYHDQGLPVIKWADFDRTVNTTLGLPFLRTSPDHGIALDQVGKPTLRPGSMLAALHPRRKMKKRYGQHFLRDRTVIHRIIDAINPTPADTLLEIGPGDGALTAPPVRQRRPPHRHRNRPRLRRPAPPPLRPAPTNHHHRHPNPRPPYPHPRPPPVSSATSPTTSPPPLLHRIAAAGRHLTDSHIMLQKEVSDRLTARPATPEYGRLTIHLTLTTTATPLFDIPPVAFHPPPPNQLNLPPPPPPRQPALHPRQPPRPHPRRLPTTPQNPPQRPHPLANRLANQRHRQRQTRRRPHPPRLPQPRHKSPPPGPHATIKP